jgi:hypothetical protein
VTVYVSKFITDGHVTSVTDCPLKPQRGYNNPQPTPGWKRELSKRIATAAITAGVVLILLVIVSFLVPPKDDTAVHCIQDAMSGTWYCAKSPVNSR